MVIASICQPSTKEEITMYSYIEAVIQQ